MEGTEEGKKVGKEGKEEGRDIWRRRRRAK
jgi:hypothetical protein